MLHGFPQTLADFYDEPAKIERLLDMILHFKLELFDELHRRFPGRIDGLFCTDDWGTQQSTFIRGQMFEDFFLERYRMLISAAHSHGWHYMLHSCGKVNTFMPLFHRYGRGRTEPGTATNVWHRSVGKAVGREDLLPCHGRHPNHHA